MLNPTPQATPLKANKPRTAPVLASNELAEFQRLAMKDVTVLVGACESTIRTKMLAGTFPQPDYRDGPRCVRWNAGTIRRWLQATTVQG